MIFETNRLRVRKLHLKDLEGFHKMQSNPKAMQYADGQVKSLELHVIEIKELISKYTLANNVFWIYAIVQKSNDAFIGTVALVKEGTEDEIGYRFLEEYWNQGFGFEVCDGLISYCRKQGLNKLIAFSIDKNKASVKILEKLNFKAIQQLIAEELQLPETKYELYL
jgi:[ribosomal protein S5]-alanine N-acetyltransferase